MEQWCKKHCQQELKDDKEKEPGGEQRSETSADQCAPRSLEEETTQMTGEETLRVKRTKEILVAHCVEPAMNKSPAEKKQAAASIS